MKRQGARQIILGFHPDLSVVVETSAAHCRAMRGCCSFASSMGPLCEWCPIGLTARFAAALKDTSVLVFTLHKLLMLVRQRPTGVPAERFLDYLCSSWPRLDDLFRVGTLTQLAHDTG